jgi:hypothetical protein
LICDAEESIKYLTYFLHTNNLGEIVMAKPFETRPATSSNKNASGFCIVCASVATTEALFKIDGAVIIQRYCDACLHDAKY